MSPEDWTYRQLQGWREVPHHLDPWRWRMYDGDTTLATIAAAKAGGWIWWLNLQGIVTDEEVWERVVGTADTLKEAMDKSMEAINRES